LAGFFRSTFLTGFLRAAGLAFAAVFTVFF